MSRGLMVLRILYGMGSMYSTVAGCCKYRDCLWCETTAGRVDQKSSNILDLEEREYVKKNCEKRITTLGNHSFVEYQY